MNGKLIEIDGVFKTLREWSAFSDVATDTIRSRVAKGRTGRDLIAPPWALKKLRGDT